MTEIRARKTTTWSRAAALLLGLALGLIAAPASAFRACPLVPHPEVPTCNPETCSPEMPNVGILKLQAENYKCFGQYDRDVAALFHKAQEYVEEHAGDAPKPAIVLDIDETSLSNWPAILDDDFTYIAAGSCDLGVKGATCGWDDWQESALDQVIAPALDLYKSAMARHITVFFITGRRDKDTMREATEANLRAAGYVGWDPKNLIMQPGNGPHLPSIVDYKAPARADIEAQGYTIIANIGDQLSDLDGGHAQMTFKVPNPFYFIP